MLVLARRDGESIYIGDDIVVTVVRIEGDRVKIGFEAPKEVKIWRSELKDAPKDDKPTMADWIERWKVASEDRQTTISQEEAERRYRQTYGSERKQNDEG